MRTGTHGGANWNWGVLDVNDPKSARSVEHATLAVLMDIREELRAISRRLDCHDTLSIPRILRRISANTHKPRRRKKATA